MRISDLSSDVCSSDLWSWLFQTSGKLLVGRTITLTFCPAFNNSPTSSRPVAPLAPTTNVVSSPDKNVLAILVLVSGPPLPIITFPLMFCGQIRRCAFPQTCCPYLLLVVTRNLFPYHG